MNIEFVDHADAHRYELRSGGRAMPRGLGNPGTFTTLQPPEGDLLATVAVINDMHIGEGCSGTAVTVADRARTAA